MRPFVSTIMVFVFALWLLPLGVFIAPSKEKILCGGQRAICLCTHMKAKKAQAVKNAVKISSPVQKESAGVSSSVFDAGAVFAHAIRSQAEQYFALTTPFYRQFVSRPVDHVPKS